jgi:hypothetical protein
MQLDSCSRHPVGGFQAMKTPSSENRSPSLRAKNSPICRRAKKNPATTTTRATTTKPSKIHKPRRRAGGLGCARRLLILCLYYQPCATGPSDQCGGGEASAHGEVGCPRIRDRCRRRTTFSAPPIPSRRARKERSISSPDGPADGASTGSWPAHISKPSPLRSTAPAGPAASHRDHFLVTATLRIAAAMEPQRPVARRE